MCWEKKKTDNEPQQEKKKGFVKLVEAKLNVPKIAGIFLCRPNIPNEAVTLVNATFRLLKTLAFKLEVECFTFQKEKVQ